MGDAKMPTATAQKAPEKKSATIYELIEKMKPQIARALPNHVTPERMTRLAITAVRNSPKLANCEAMSLLGAFMTASQLGLEVNTPLGHAYVIPYSGKNGNQAQFQLGYKGLIQLCHNSGMYRRLIARSVDEADEFDYSLGLDERLVHNPARVASGKTVFYYAVYEIENGGRSFVVWSRAKVEAHAKQYSKAYDSGPWKTAFDQMAMKTCLIDLLRYAPKSVEIAQAIAADSRTLSVNPSDPDLMIDTIDGEWEATE